VVSVPRVVIAAPGSGHGKTSVATGLLGALRQRGLAVSPHKVGPDYIDPGYHALAAGRPGRNLDPWLVGEDRIAPMFTHGAATPGPADIAVIEGVMVAAAELVEIGEHCMFANGCFVTDADHRFDDPEKPVPWQGFTPKGPTRIGDNVWCGAHVVITGGVRLGERCVIGANSVVTADIPPFSVAAGAPARVLKGVRSS
jgi:acetyltransferase-like isoleucine patch superfamily enzyme